MTSDWTTAEVHCHICPVPPRSMAAPNMRITENREMPHVFLSKVKPFFITYTNLDAIATKTHGGEMLQMPLVTQEVVEWVACV